MARLFLNHCKSANMLQDQWFYKPLVPSQVAIGTMVGHSPPSAEWPLGACPVKLQTYGGHTNG